MGTTKNTNYTEKKEPTREVRAVQAGNAVNAGRNLIHRLRRFRRWAHVETPRAHPYGWLAQVGELSSHAGTDLSSSVAENDEESGRGGRTYHRVTRGHSGGLRNGGKTGEEPRKARNTRKSR